MNVIGIIPARYESSRFPGKPLARIHGKSMVRRVYEQSSLARSLSKVVIATDDDRIFEHVRAFGGEVVMTSADHQSGTDRCAEVAGMDGYHADIVINIQGDEPFIHPEQIDQVAHCFKQENVQIATLVKVIENESELNDPNTPKVVFSAKSGRALYFSRKAIPYCEGSVISEMVREKAFYKHIGIYGYRTGTLAEICKLPAGRYEQAERLEQLRWLEHDYPIHVKVTQHSNHAVDSPGDVAAIEAIMPPDNP